MEHVAIVSEVRVNSTLTTNLKSLEVWEHLSVRRGGFYDKQISLDD